jgi:hypothetical protein
LPDLAAQPDDDDDRDTAADEEARQEAFAAEEAAKFVRAMGVSWVRHPEVQSALTRS